MRVLIVDDSRSMRKILSKMMSQLGHTEIDEAEHGASALERMALDRPDIALVDWHMPVMGGHEFVQAVRGNRDYDQTKLMIVTSETSPRVVYDAMKAGADEYAMKPLNADVISDKLQLLGLN